jgi:hypothetical protein
MDEKRIEELNTRRRAAATPSRNMDCAAHPAIHDRGLMTQLQCEAASDSFRPGELKPSIKSY